MPMPYALAHGQGNFPRLRGSTLGDRSAMSLGQHIEMDWRIFDFSERAMENGLPVKILVIGIDGCTILRAAWKRLLKRYPELDIIARIAPQALSLVLFPPRTFIASVLYKCWVERLG